MNDRGPGCEVHDNALMCVFRRTGRVVEELVDVRWQTPGEDLWGGGGGVRTTDVWGNTRIHTSCKEHASSVDGEEPVQAKYPSSRQWGSRITTNLAALYLRKNTAMALVRASMVLRDTLFLGS